ncbi:MAG: diguanylate cyclase [Thiolinea sp.]
MAVSLLDLDKFKRINDSCGHSAGDALLSQLATVISSDLPEQVDLYRIGGDEFGLLMNMHSVDAINAVAEQLLHTVKHYQFIWQHESYSLGISIGISILTRDTLEQRDPLIEADTACYHAKLQGGNQIITQTATHKIPITKQAASLSKLQHLLKNPGMELFAQPIITPANGDKLPCRLELLLRHRNEQGKLYTPVNLLHAGEYYGMSQLIDQWVIQESLRHAEALLAQGWMLNINISPQKSGSGKFYQFPAATHPE